MCCGKFVIPADLDAGSTGPGLCSQLALGTDTGAIYIMANFEVSCWASMSLGREWP